MAFKNLPTRSKIPNWSLTQHVFLGMFSCNWTLSWGCVPLQAPLSRERDIGRKQSVMSCKTLCMHICTRNKRSLLPQGSTATGKEILLQEAHVLAHPPGQSWKSHIWFPVQPLFFYLWISDLEMYKPSCKGSQVHAYRFFLQQVSLTMTGCLRRDSVLILLSFNILVFEVSYICEKPLGRIKSVLI